jgi:hypothetical protein
MQRIPNFPESKKLTLDDKEEIRHFVCRFPPYADYNFTALYCYNVNDKVEVSWLNNNLVVLFQDCVSEEMFYSFIGENKVTETALTLLSHMHRDEIQKELRIVPECTRILLDGNISLAVREDKNNPDYILSTDALIAFSGNNYKEKRKSVNKFLRTYPDHKTEILDLDNDVTKQQATDLFHIWIEGKKVPENKFQYELKAFNRLVSDSRHFNLVVFGVFIEGRLAAFNIIELLDHHYAISHFGKYNVSVAGIFPFLLSETAKFLKEKKYSFINYEQDLGIPGLRESKQQLRPVHFLRKYIISRSDRPFTA